METSLIDNEKTESRLMYAVLKWRNSHITDRQMTIILAFFIGFFASVAAFFLHFIIKEIQLLLTSSFTTSTYNWWYLVFPVIGIFINLLKCLQSSRSQNAGGLHAYFDDSVASLAKAEESSVAACYEKLKETYDGYHFSEDSIGMYNPFSLLNTFSANKFRDYWFETGTPTLLVNVMKQTSFDVTTLSDNVIVASDDLNGMQDIMNRPVPLFFQTGYLTIKHYDKEFQEYTLGFPNKEVKNGFLKFIYSYYVPVNPAEGNTTTSKLARALRAGDPVTFMKILEALFANTTYQIQGNSEKNFQYAMYIIMELLGEYVQAERSTSNGRIDLLLQTKDYIYIIELKIDKTADAALQQIEEKGYAKPFADDSRKIFKIGASFSTANRRIEEWRVVE